MSTTFGMSRHAMSDAARSATRSSLIGGLLAAAALTLVVVLATAATVEFSRPGALTTLTAIIRVVGASLCMLAGALRLSLHDLTGDRDGAVLGVALLLVGAVLLPSSVVATMLTGSPSYVEPSVRLVESLLLLGLLMIYVDRRGRLVRPPRQMLMVVAPVLAVGGLVTAVAVELAQSAVGAERMPTPWTWALVTNILGTLAWATSAVSLARRPWPPGGREALGFVWVAALISAMRVVGYAGTPALVLASATVVMVAAITAAGRAMHEIDEASAISRQEAAARATLLADTRLDLTEESARGSALRHDALNSLAAIRAAMESLELAEVDLESSRSRLLRAGLGEIDHLEHLFTRRGGEGSPVAFAVDEVIEGIVDSRRPTGLEVEFDPCRLHVWGIPGDFATVLQNLLVNAHIHGGGHSVSVHCQVEDGDDFLSVYVRDNGPGIPRDAQPVIFDPGVRASSRPGAGLGLHISRELMREQGGDLMLRNVHAGAEFVVRIPLVRAGRLG